MSERDDIPQADRYGKPDAQSISEIISGTHARKYNDCLHYHLR